MTTQSQPTDDGHPIQFDRLTIDLVVCTLCGAAVPIAVRWQDKHRQKHEEHNNLHDALLATAAHRQLEAKHD